MFRFSYKQGVALLLSLTLTGTILASAEPSQPSDVPSDTSDTSVSSIISVESSPSSAEEHSSESVSSFVESAASSDTESIDSAHSTLTSEASDETVHTSSLISSSKPAANSKPSQPKPTISPEWNDQLNEALNNASDWIRNNQESSLYFIALGCAGKSVGSQQYEILLNQIANLDSDQVSLYDLSLFALNATFCGVNATRVRNKNLIDLMSQTSSLDLHDTATLVYTLWAFDSNQYADDENASVNRNLLVRLLLDRQQEDGSFPAAEGESVVELTALVLSALSGYSERTDVKSAHSKGLEYIRKHYASASLKTESSDVLSQIIIAMNCLGINVNDSRFIKDGENIHDILLEYLGEDGGFKQKQQDSLSNTRSTELAVIALASIKYFSNPYVLRQNLADASSVTSVSTPFDSDMLSLGWLWWATPILLFVVGGVFLWILICRKKKKTS